MHTVTIPQWSPGFAKVSCTELLREKCGLSLPEAKKITDAILRREAPKVAVASLHEARSLIVELAKLGASARIPEQADYDPAARARNALAASKSGLTVEVINVCESLVEHGEWEMAVSTAQFHIDQGTHQMNPGDMVLLTEVAVEFGHVPKQSRGSTKSEA